MTLGRFARLALLVLVALLAVPATASAVDLRGKWNCCGSGGAGAQVFVITSQSGTSFSGHADYPSGSTFSPITGTINGNAVSLTTGPYTGSSYSATFTGTVAADNRTMSGSWRSNANQSGTWTATRASNPPAPPPPPPPCIGSAATCQGMGLYVGNPQLNPNQVGPFLFGCVDNSGTRAQTNCRYGTAIEYPEAEFILLTRGPAQNNLDNNLVPGIFTDTRSRLLRSPFASAARHTRLLVLARSTIYVGYGRSRNLKLALRLKAHRLFLAARARGVRGVTHATLRVTLNGSTVRSRRISIRVG